MSGVFGFVGNDDCAEILVNGLQKMQMRGNSASGVALKFNNDILSVKVKGGAENLKSEISRLNKKCSAGIAQCSNSYRVAATQLTCAPSANNLFAVAMDGYIDNFDELKQITGTPFSIKTDEDLLLAMLCVNYMRDTLSLINKVFGMIVGSVSAVIMAADSNAIYCHCGVAPIVIGIGTTGYYISSEVGALCGVCSKYLCLKCGETAIIDTGKLVVLDAKQKRIKHTFNVMPNVTYNVYDYLLCDDIYYTQSAVKHTLQNIVQNESIATLCPLLNKRNLEHISRFIVISDYSLSLAVAYNIEHLANVPCVAVQPMDFKCGNCYVDRESMVLAICPMGEDLDMALSVIYAKKFGTKTVLITANKYSNIANLSDNVIAVDCDFISDVASIRDYAVFYLAMCFVSLAIGSKLNNVSELNVNVSIKMAEMLSGKISAAIKRNSNMDSIAKMLKSAKNIYITGMGVDMALSIKFADVLRKTTALNASAVAFGADVCGTIVCFVTSKDGINDVLRYLRCAKSGGCNVIIITTIGLEDEMQGFDNILAFNDSVSLFNPIVCITGAVKLAIIAGENTMDNTDNMPA